jgi:hypothetical protein
MWWCPSSLGVRGPVLQDTHKDVYKATRHHQTERKPGVLLLVVVVVMVVGPQQGHTDDDDDDAGDEIDPPRGVVAVCVYHA